MIKFVDITEEQFIKIEHHFRKEDSMSININHRVTPTCITITTKDGVIARAHVPRTKKDAKEYKSEYVVRSDAYDKYLSDTYLV